MHLGKERLAEDSIPVEAEVGRIEVDLADIPAADFVGDNIVEAVAIVPADLGRRQAALDTVDSALAVVARLSFVEPAVVVDHRRSTFCTSSNIPDTKQAGKGSQFHLRFKFSLLCNEVLFDCYLEAIALQIAFVVLQFSLTKKFSCELPTILVSLTII